MESVYNIFIGKWLWLLYRKGPISLGFWGGLQDAEVCARMAGNSEVFDWMHGSGVVADRCLNMISRAFQSFSVTVQLVLYIGCFYMTVSTVRQWILIKTFAHELAHLQLTNFKNESTLTTNKP